MSYIQYKEPIIKINDEEITNLVSTIDIFEDIYGNFISGRIIVLDAIGWINKNPIMGGEDIFISVTSQDEQFTYESKKLKVYLLSDRKYMKERMEAYVIHFVSDVVIRNVSAPKLDKSHGFRRVGSNVKKISELVKLICEDESYLRSKVELKEEPENDAFILPKLRPLEALNWIAGRIKRKPIGKSENAYNFLCYQTIDEIMHFDCIDCLIEEGLKGGDNNLKFVFDMQNLGDGQYQKYVNDNKLPIISHETNSSYNFIKDLQRGLLGTTIFEHDQIKQRIKHFKIKESDLFNSHVHLNDIRMLFEKVKEASQDFEESVNQFYPLKPNDFIGGGFADNWQERGNRASIYRRYQLDAINRFKIKALIPGNFPVIWNRDLKLGSVIELDVNIEGDAPDRLVINPKYSGNYLVTALRHTFKMAAGVALEYKVITELSRDSFPS